MADKIYPKGIVTFSPRDGAPDFVKGTIIINPNELFAWLKENSLLLTEYNGKKQLKLQLLHGNKGLYVAVDTYTGSSSAFPAKDDLPF
jgi:hypothetical protein